jgi:hypothetical protein
LNKGEISQILIKITEIKMKSLPKYLTAISICLFIILILLSNKTNGQDLSVGTDIVNRYVWRGSDLGKNSPSIQPTVKLTTAGLTAGFWGAYSFANAEALNEIDIYASYSVNIAESGSISLGFTDYTNPNNGTKMGNFNNYDNEKGAGAHSVELNAGYTGPESFPISISFNAFLYNVKNNPIYFQLGYSTTVKEVGFSAFVGGTPGEDAGYYGVTNFSIMNVGFTANKSIKVTDSFAIPIFGSVILNPASENLFYVVGISL